MNAAKSSNTSVLMDAVLQAFVSTFLFPPPSACAMRILVVEDEPTLLNIVARFLRDEGYAVDEACDGEDGLFKAESYDYDAILLDLMLPRLDGWTLLSRLRKTRKTPVLLLTARDAVADRIKGLDLGADDYLIKPFDLNELLARIRALIRRAAGQATPVLEIGDLQIDTRARTVSRDGILIALTAREYALLELLALRRGEIVTKTQIYDHLYDEHEDTLSNLIEVYISNIRKKLGRDLIATRRGQGYILDG